MMNLDRLFLVSLLFVVQAVGSVREANQLIDRYEEKMELWARSYQAAQTVNGKKQIEQERPKIEETYRRVIRALSKELQSPQSLRGLNWLYKEASGQLKNSGKTQDVLLRSIERYHYKLPGAGNLAIAMSELAGPAEMKVMEKIAAQNPSKIDRGLANIALSVTLSQLGDDVEIIAKRLKYLKSAIEFVPANTKIWEKSASEVISDQVYVITNLTKGRKAPNLQGQDISGQPISLDRYDGRVRAIVFWDEMSGSLENFLSVMRDTKALAENSNAVLIGVYAGDETKLRSWIADRSVDWVNILDQKGTLTEQYRIAQTPTIFILNKQGLVQGNYAPGSLANLTISALGNEEE